MITHISTLVLEPLHHSIAPHESGPGCSIVVVADAARTLKPHGPAMHCANAALPSCSIRNALSLTHTRSSRSEIVWKQRGLVFSNLVIIIASETFSNRAILSIALARWFESSRDDRQTSETLINLPIACRCHGTPKTPSDINLALLLAYQPSAKAVELPAR